MRIKKGFKICMVLILAFLIYRLWIKERILLEWTLSKGKRACETGNFETVSNLTSQDYSDRYGTNFAEFKKEIKKFFKEFKNIDIYVMRKKVKFFSKKWFGAKHRAEVYLRLIISFQHKEAKKGQQRSILKMVFNKEKGKWKLASMEEDVEGKVGRLRIK